MKGLFKIGTQNVGGSIPDPFTNPFTIRVDNANAFLVETAAGTDVFNVNTLTSQVGFANGTAAAPSMTFLSDIDSGWYRIGANNIGMTLNGVKSWDYTSTITQFSGSEATGTGLIMKVWNTSAVNSFAAVRLSVGAVEGVSGGTFFGSSGVTFAAGIVNGMTLRPLSTTQDVGIAVGNNVIATGAGANFVVKANGAVVIGDNSTSTTVGRTIIDNSATTALNTVSALYVVGNTSSTYALTLTSGGNTGIAFNAATGLDPFFHFRVNNVTRADFFYNAGTDYLVFNTYTGGMRFSIASGGASNDFLNVTNARLATWSSSLSGATPAITYSFATSGAGSASRIGQSTTLAAGATTSGITVAGFYDNVVAGTGATWTSDASIYSYRPNGNFGFSGYARATTAGTNVGITGLASLGNLNISVYGAATVTKNNAVNAGVVGLGLNAGTGTAAQFGGYFGLYNGGGANTALALGTSAALVADNWTTTSNILSLRDNNTAVFTVADGGTVTIAPTAKTSGTGPQFLYTAPANTGIDNSEYSDVTFNCDRSVQFTGGGAQFQYATGMFIGSPSFSAASAQSVGVIANVVFGSVAHSGSNLTADVTANAVFVGDNGRSAVNTTGLFSYVGIESGVSAVTRISAIDVVNIGGSNISLGNQTSTLTKLAGIFVDAVTFESNTNVRTVTDAAGAIFNAPTAGTNAVFTNTYGVLVETGDLRVSLGRIRGNRGPDVTAASTITVGAGNTFVVTGNTNIDYITTTGWNEGSEIVLYFTGTPTVNNEAGSVPADTAELKLDGGANFTVGAGGAMLTFQFVDGVWAEKSRTSY